MDALPECDEGNHRRTQERAASKSVREEIQQKEEAQPKDIDASVPHSVMAALRRSDRHCRSESRWEHSRLVFCWLRFWPVWGGVRIFRWQDLPILQEQNTRRSAALS